MPNDYYPEPDDQSAATETEDVEGMESKDGETESEGKTALLPKSMFGDVKPGDTVTVKVTHIYEDEVEVEKTGEAEESEEEDELKGDEEFDMAEGGTNGEEEEG